MKKIKAKPLTKYYQNEKYTFINGIANVPNMYDKKGKNYTITLTEFNALSKVDDETINNFN